MNPELGVCRDGFLCFIRGVTAVAGHVVTCCQDHDQFSSYTHIKRGLLQCTSHCRSILNHKERLLISVFRLDKHHDTNIQSGMLLRQCILTLNQAKVAFGFPPVAKQTIWTVLPERKGTSSGGALIQTFWGGSVDCNFLWSVPSWVFLNMLSRPVFHLVLRDWSL